MARLFTLVLFVTPLLLWVSCAEGPPPAPPPGERARAAADRVWEFRVRLMFDRPALPDFEIDGKPAPAPGRPALVVALEAGADPAGVLADALAAVEPFRSARSGFDVFWAAPDEATAKMAAAAAGTSGALSPGIDRFLENLPRPALLVVDADRRARAAFFRDHDWFRELVSGVARGAAEDANPDAILPARVPAPSTTFAGALACASCHRRHFKDWMLTPHSIAYIDLVRIKREEDPECIGCHVIGWKKGGYAEPADRRLADVQCEACHLPEKTHHATAPMLFQDYVAVCRTCHTEEFALTSDHTRMMKYVAHSQARLAEAVPMDKRQFHIDTVKSQTYIDFCASSEYVGSASCQPCHGKSHADWALSKHAKAFATLEKAGKAEDPACVKCHVTGMGHTGGFVNIKDTPALAGVGCESCHGPGKRHIEAKTKEERLESIFKFDEKCPTCVVERVCRTCHDEKNDKDFDLARDRKKILHRDK
jgi:hypothetical protein